MRTLMLATAALLIACPAFAAHKKAVPAPDSKPECSVSLDSFMKYEGEQDKHVSLSHVLNDAQYAFLKTEGRKHTTKTLSGDGAVIAIIGQEYLALFTKGSGEGTSVCAVMVIPQNAVAAIIGMGEGHAKDKRPLKVRMDLSSYEA